jgi:hypothetical protein
MCILPTMNVDIYVVSSSSSSWPLLGSGEWGSNPSHWVETSSAVGFHWCLETQSDIMSNSLTSELEKNLLLRQQHYHGKLMPGNC